MNIETINYVSMIAGTAADRLNAGKTLKACKAWLAEAMTEETTPFVNHEGVNFADVNSRPNLLNAVNINTKGGFIRQCETMVAKMVEAREVAVRATRVAYTIKRLAAIGITATEGDVMALELVQKEFCFNVQQAVDAIRIAHFTAETSEGCVDGYTVEVGQIIEGKDGRQMEVTHIMRMAGYTDVSGYAPGSRALHDSRSFRFDTCNSGRFEYGERETRLIKPAPVEVIELIEDPANVAELAAKLVPVVQAEAEADTLAARTTAKRSGRPRKVVTIHYVAQVSDTRHAVATFHIHLSNGKRYEYTEGREFAHILSATNASFKRMTRSPHIVAACKDAITIHRKIA